MALNREPKYVWAVYDYAWVRDDDNAITGSFSAVRTLKKKAASSYTINEGEFALKHPTSTTVGGLALGDYIVSVSTSGDSYATTGQYLYEVTAYSGGYNTTITYKRYSAVAVRGDTELYRVESDTLDYPVDGEQDGLWYVMLKGEYAVYVWDVYEKLTQYQEKTSNHSYFGPGSWPVRLLYSSSYSFDPGTGKYTLIKGTDKSFTENYFDNQSGAPNSIIGKYYQKYNKKTSSWNTDEMYYSATNLDYTDHTWFAEKWYRSESVTIKGTSTGTTVESDNNSAYPQDGISGDYWYVYSHSYTYEFDNR